MMDEAIDALQPIYSDPPPVSLERALVYFPNPNSRCGVFQNNVLCSVAKF
jgi:hypothetical protein